MRVPQASSLRSDTMKKTIPIFPVATSSSARQSGPTSSGNTKSLGSSNSVRQQAVSPLSMETSMKLTVAKKMALLAGTALLGIVLLAGFSQYQMNKVYQAANYANINTVPSLKILSAAIEEFGRIRVRLDRLV